MIIWFSQLQKIITNDFPWTDKSTSVIWVNISNFLWHVTKNWKFPIMYPNVTRWFAYPYRWLCNLFLRIGETHLADPMLRHSSCAIFCDKSVTKKSNWAISEERWLFWKSSCNYVNLPHRKRFVMILEQRVASSARNLLRSHLSFFAVTKNDFSHKNITSTRRFGSQKFNPKQ